MELSRDLKKDITAYVVLACMTILATFPIIFHRQDCMYGSFYKTDLRGSVWFLWWLKFSSSHAIDFYLCPFLSAPFNFELSQQGVFWISSSLAWLGMVFLSPVAYLNVWMLLGFLLSGIIVYHSVLALTSSRTAGLFSALVFAFSPYHLNKVIEFGSAFQGHWVALYFGMLFLLKEKVGRFFHRVLFAGIAFALVIDFNAYYAFFCAIGTFVFLTYCGFYQWKDKTGLLFGQKQGRQAIRTVFSGFSFFWCVCLVLLCAVLIETPFFIPFLSKISDLTALSAQPGNIEYVRPFKYLFAQSARPLSYLLPASTHPVFGGFTQKMFGSFFYGRGSIEQTLYLGWIPLILSFVAFRHWRARRKDPARYPEYAASRENFYIGFFIFLAWVAFLFSLPPYLDLGLFKLYLPSYFTYQILPMFRAYARFGMVVMLCVSILAGYGIKFALEKLKTRRARFLLAACIFLGTMFEFTNIPPWRVTDLSVVPPVYRWLKEQPEDIIVAEYPMMLGGVGEAHENYDYLFYQTKHQKRLVNGAQLGTQAYRVKKKIMKLTDPQTPKILAGLGTRYVIIHRDLYLSGEYDDSVDVLGQVPQLEETGWYRLVQDFGDAEVYETTVAPLSMEEILELAEVG